MPESSLGAGQTTPLTSLTSRNLTRHREFLSIQTGPIDSHWLNDSDSSSEEDADAKSEVSDTISELPEWHQRFDSNQRCRNSRCNGQSHDGCRCNCEICVFRHIADGHDGIFKWQLLSAFRNSKTFPNIRGGHTVNPHLAGPRRRKFYKWKDYPLDYVLNDLRSRTSAPVLDRTTTYCGGFDDQTHVHLPASVGDNKAIWVKFRNQYGRCTETAMWDASSDGWSCACGINHNEGPAKPMDPSIHKYNPVVLPCFEKWCLFDSVSHHEIDQMGNDLTERRYTRTTAPPPTPLGAPLFGRRLVCEDHFENTKRAYGLETQEKINNFHKSHLVRFCKTHEKYLLEKYPNGKNTCTCRNVSFTRFQCGSCFKEKVDKLQRNFRARVDPKWRGNADKTMTGNARYYDDWKAMRTMLQRDHPCSMRCGRKRQRGLNQNKALDCRCCGGKIITATRPAPPVARKVKTAKRKYVRRRAARSTTLNVAANAATA